MAFGDVGSDSFEFYEGIRIVIPGALMAGLIKTLQWTLDDEQSLSADFGVVLLAAIGLGLIAYFVDIPRQSALYNADLPSARFAKRFERELRKAKVDPRNAYFVLSDEVLPSAIRARGLYSGSMFRIGFEAILFVGTLQFIPWLIALRNPGTGISSEVDYFWWLLALVVLPILWPWAVLTNERHKSDDYEAKHPTPTQRMRYLAAAVPAKLKDDLSFKDVGVVAVATTFLVVGLSWNFGGRADQALVLVGLSIPIALWLVRFVFGGGTFVRRCRTPFDRSTVLLLFLIAALPPPIIARYRGDHAFLDDPERVALWLTAAVLTSLLIAARGHEKRLWGGYSSQRAWFELNEGKVIAAISGSDSAVKARRPRNQRATPRPKSTS